MHLHRVMSCHGTNRCGVGYTIAKYNMTLSAIGLSEEFKVRTVQYCVQWALRLQYYSTVLLRYWYYGTVLLWYCGTMVLWYYGNGY